MIRDFASTAHVYAADSIRRCTTYTNLPSTLEAAYRAPAQTLLRPREQPLAAVYLQGFGDAA